MIRILVVDDQNLVREGIKMLLEKSKGILIVGEAKDGQSALEKINTLEPDIVLLDIEMPGISGLAVADQISFKHPQIKIIMLSSHEDARYVQKATALGAKGYLLKNVSSQELEWSVKLVAQGYSAIKSELLEEQLSHNNNKSQADFLPVSANDYSHASRGDSSTTTERNLGGSVTTMPEADQVSIRQLETLLARKEVKVQASLHRQNKKRRNKKNFFHSTNALKLKRTIVSFEFKLLVFIIIFSLAFLVFIALS